MQSRDCELVKLLAMMVSPLIFISTLQCLLLVIMYNKAFKSGMLTASQKLALITLIFKKGDTRETSNYCPISLTNCDYKILAYILTGRLEEFLPHVIHPNQTAYMKNRFIGTNI